MTYNLSLLSKSPKALGLLFCNAGTHFGNASTCPVTTVFKSASVDEEV